jgi:hypothetical protein
MFIHDSHERLMALRRRRGERPEAPGTYRPSQFVAVRRSRRHAQSTSQALRPLIPPLR